MDEVKDGRKECNRLEYSESRQKDRGVLILRADVADRLSHYSLMIVLRQGIVCETECKPSSPKWLSGLPSHSMEMALIEPKIKIGLVGAAFGNFESQF